MKLRIRHKMAAMAILTVVPMLVYSFWNFGYTLYREKDRIAEQNLLRAREVARQYEAILNSTLSGIAPLARHPAVTSLDTPRADLLLAELLPLFPEVSNFVLADMAGRNVGSGLPSPTVHSLTYTDRPWFTDTLAGRQVISDIYTSKLLKVPAVMVTQPVFSDTKEQAGVLGFALSLPGLSQQIATTGLPANSTIVILDRSNAVIACTLHPQNIGKPFGGSTALLAALAQKEGKLAAPGSDGIERLYSFTTLGLSNWKVIVGVPTKEAFYFAVSSAGQHLILILLVCFTGVSVAYLMARKMCGNIDQLVNGFAEIERGNLDYRLTLGGCDELADLAEAFNRMTAARLQAETEVQRLNLSLEKQVRDRTMELQTANQELESFCYSVSHDLRAPLRHMRGFAQMIREDCADTLDPKGLAYLEKITAASDRMDELITDLLKLSRYSRAELTMEELDLSGIARSMEAQLRSEEPQRAVAITIQDGLTARGDRPLISAVLQNLMGNAWKYSSHTDCARIEVGMGEANGERYFYVRDNGAGFDMAYADKLFTPFHRLHNAKEFDGTGIGLASVKRIITRHGGRIWAEAAPGAGATFFFTLA
jgi:signal transduction histidine kinase